MKSTMKTLLILLSMLSAAKSSFTSCEPASTSLQINQLEADPLDRVSVNQLVKMRVRFSVPTDSWVPSGMIRIAASVNLVPVTTWEEPLCAHVRCPLTAGEHEFETKWVFPQRILGRIVADITAVNASGTPLLCARWTVWGKLF